MSICEPVVCGRVPEKVRCAKQHGHYDRLFSRDADRAFGYPPEMSPSGIALSPEFNAKSSHAQGVPVIIFHSGFPDTYNSFEKLVPEFDKTHTIVKCIMPGYNKRRLPFKYMFGYSFETIVDSLCLVVKVRRMMNEMMNEYEGLLTRFAPALLPLPHLHSPTLTMIAR